MKVIVTHCGMDFLLSRRTCSKIEMQGGMMVDVSLPESVPPDAEKLTNYLQPFFAKYELSGVWLFAALQSFIESGARHARLEYDDGESLILNRTDH